MDPRTYTATLDDGEARRYSTDEFERSMRAVLALIESLNERCMEDDLLRDAVTTMLDSYAVQLRAVERACRRDDDTA